MDYEVLELTDEEFNLLFNTQQSNELQSDELQSDELQSDELQSDELQSDELILYSNGESSTLVELPPDLIDNVSDIRKFTLLIFLFLVIALGIALVNKITNLFD